MRRASSRDPRRNTRASRLGGGTKQSSNARRARSLGSTIGLLRRGGGGIERNDSDEGGCRKQNRQFRPTTSKLSPGEQADESPSFAPRSASLTYSRSLSDGSSGCLKVPSQRQSISSPYPSRRGSTTSSGSGSGSPVDKEHVKFSDTRILRHGMILGDNPSVQSGPPITLDWKVEDTEVLSVEEFEEQRQKQREQQQQQQQQQEEREPDDKQQQAGTTTPTASSGEAAGKSSNNKDNMIISAESRRQWLLDRGYTETELKKIEKKIQMVRLRSSKVKNERYDRNR